MFRLDRTAALFSVKTYAAAVLALFVSFSIDLPRPYWAVLTVYIISQPLAGAVRSKALYRVIGTLVGAIFSVLVVPPLVDTPYLLSFVLSLWVGLCLGISLLDRTPRAYMLMLAGYTASLICFPAVATPDLIFDVAVSRVEEITLGIACATLVHASVLPQSVGVTLQARLASWLRDADRWALDILQNAGRAAAVQDSRDLAGAATEIHLLALLLPFDVAQSWAVKRIVDTAHERFLRLIPLLSATADRVSALANLPGGLDGQTRALLARSAAWLAGGAAAQSAGALADAWRAHAAAQSGQDWAALLRGNLARHAGDLVTALAQAHALAAISHGAQAGTLAQVPQARPPRLHRDAGLAFTSGLSSGLTMMIVCGVWISTGWQDGASAAALAGVFCALFAALDDPAPAIGVFGVFFLAAVVVAGFLQFAVLPGVDGFIALVIFLAPPLLLTGYFIPQRRTALPGLAFAVGLPSALALQETYAADFAGFVNANAAVFVALFIALVTTRALRSQSLDAALRRLLRRNWAHLAQLARNPREADPADVAAEMVDRLGLIVPRLAAGGAEIMPIRDPLAELRIAVNLAQIGQFYALEAQDAAQAPHLAPPQAGYFAVLLERVGAYFASRVAGVTQAPPQSVLAALDHCLASVIARPPGAAADHATVAALVGLRRNLFPDAPIFLAGGGA